MHQAMFAPGRAPRRSVLAGAGAVALAGCQSPPAPSPPSENGAASEDGGDGTAGQVVAQVTDVPIGGGVIKGVQGVVLTQPEPGEIRAFSSVCTHQGCTLASVGDGTINCDCHGSRFNIIDGSVVAGPATSRLPEKSIIVEDGTIRLG